MARTEVTGTQIRDGSVDLTVDVTGILPVANGGTGSNTLALNNVLLGNGTGALQAVAPGTTGNVLTSNGTSWTSAAPAGAGEVTLTGTQTLTNKTLTAPTITDPKVETIRDNAGNGYIASANNLVYLSPLGRTGLEVGSVSGAVNRIRTTASLTGVTPSVAAVGSDANINLNLGSVGTGVVQANGVPVVTTTGTQALTNKTISGASNTITNLPASATPDAARLVCTTATGDVGAENGAETWAKIATLSIVSSEFFDINLHLVVIGGYARNVMAQVAVWMRSGATNSNPSVDVEIIGGVNSVLGLSNDSFKIISGGWNTNAELWMRKNSAYGQFSIYEIGRKVVPGTTVTYTVNPPWQSATPVGAVNNVSSDGVKSGMKFASDSTLTGTQLISTVAQGTAPLTVTSSTMVANLNAQYVGSIGASALVTLTGTQTLTNKSLTSPAITTPTGIVKGDVGLGSVDNTADANKAVLSATKLTTARTINGVSFDGTANITVADSTKQATSEKGQANGYASLDSGGKVPVAQLPNSIMEYQGTWNASTNTPTLANGTGSPGDVYRVSVAGTSLSLTFDVGDYVIYSGTTWEKSDTTDAVASVAGKTGNVTLASTDVGLGNVDNTSNATERAATATLTNKTIALGSNTVSGTLAQFNTAVTDADLARTDAANTFTGVQTMTSPALTTPVITGTPTGTGVATAATVSTLALRDANANLTADNFISAVESTVAAGGTTALTIASPAIQVFTSNGSHTLRLPTTDITAGMQYRVINQQSSGSVAVQSSAAALVATVPAGFVGDYIALVNTPTTAAHWRGLVYATTGQIVSASNTLAAFAASTTNAIGVGTIELGHASDTTLSRSAAGTLAVEGVNVVMTGGALGTPSSGNLANCTFPTLNQNTTGSAATLTTSRNFQTNLASTSAAGFNGSADVTPGVTGTLPVGNGGTGVATITGLVKGTGTTAMVAATAGTDYVAPGGALGTPSSGTLTNCTFPTLNQNTTGSAATLTTARTIGGVSFNGSANIDLPGVNTAGAQNTSGTAAGLSSTLAVGSGGTGSTTLTANNVLLGNGTSALQVVAPGATGNVLTSNGTTWTSAAPTGGGGVAGFTTTVTSATAVVLTSTSNSIQEFTGSTAQTVRLPTTSVVAGARFTIINNSSALLTVQSSSAATVVILAAQSEADFTALVATPTTPAHWDSLYEGTVVASGKKLTVSNSLTLAGTDATTMTFPGANDTVVTLAAAQSLTNKTLTTPTLTTPVINGIPTGTGVATANTVSTLVLRDASGNFSAGTITATALAARVNPRIGTVASSATPTIDLALHDQYNITALAVAITSIAFTGTPVDGQKLTIRIKDNGTARAIAWSSAFTSSGVAVLPTTTVASKTHLIGLLYDSAAAKWVCVASDSTGY
jgi:hypothetical protein